MKISKLFHWLYGFVMLLPIFAIGSACLISTFNMASKEESEIHYKYETNDVNSVNDLIVGNLYHFHIENDTLNGNFDFSNNFNIIMNFININYYDFSNYDLEGFDYLPTSDSNNGYITMSLTVTNTQTYFDFYNTYNMHNNYFSEIETISLDNFDFSLDGDFIYINSDNLTYYPGNITKSTYNIIDFVETHNVSAQDVFYNSVDKVQEMPIFSWAYNSFLVAPFQYILVLFGVPSNHVIVELLSYWLAVSIIWLVFDLIMYIPLLVHRWLDKGVLE